MEEQAKIKKKIEIECDSAEECLRVGTLIHDQLVGLKDYINNNIILNCTDGDNVIRLYILEECEEIPRILI